MKNGRIDIERTGGSLVISVPVKKNIPLIIFLAASFGIWLFGEKLIIALIPSLPVFQGYNIFFLLWFILWTGGGFYLFLKLLWLSAGKEIITVTQDRLIICKAFAGIRNSREYLLKNIRDIQIKPGILNRSRSGIIRSLFFRGYIIFSYGIKTVTFLNTALDEEAEKILDEIKRHIKK